MAVAANAQSKLDMQSRMKLVKERMNVAAPAEGKKRAAVKADEKAWTTAFVELKDANDKAELEASGTKILRQYGNVVIVAVQMDEVENVANLKSIKRMQLSREVKKKLNDARRVTGIDKIHSGLDLPQAYTGKGVVTGLVDNGFDANNINFRDKNGKTRIGYMSRYIQSSASKDGYVCYNYYPDGMLPDDDELTFSVESFTSDGSEDYHATHTCGIMAGGYTGDISYSVMANEAGDSKNVTGPNPYYGGSIDSEIVCSCGDLVDTFIAMGVEDIVNYSLYSNGYDQNFEPLAPKPCVVNLSLGSNLGAHDPNYMFNYILDYFSDYATICVASGNEADYPIACSKVLTAEDPSLKTLIHPIYEGEYSNGSTTYYNLRYGSSLIYADDNRPFEVQVVIYNKKRGTIAKRFSVGENTEGNMVIWTTGGDYAVSGATEDLSLSTKFNGYIAIATALDEDLNRYYAGVMYYTSDNQLNNADDNYILGIVVNGEDGQRIDIYGDDGYCYFDAYGQEAKGFQNGSRNGTISDMACGYKTICVGSYNIKNHWASMDGYSYGYDGFPQGAASRFSSYGTLADGRNLPHICAPGTVVISSINSYCVENPSMGFTDVALQGKYVEPSGRTNYWMQERGTSMSTPLVAGAVALWLEANPDLTSTEIRDIIMKTAIVDEDVNSGDPVQWGAGKFDAYAGLKEVLRRKANSIESTSADKGSDIVISQVGDRQFRVLDAGAKAMNVTVYNAMGQQVSNSTANGDETLINASGWNKGIYLIKANNSRAQRVIVK